MDSLVSLLFTPTAGAWLALVLALLVFSAIAGDQLFSRLAQHILIGAVLGYGALLVVRDLLVPAFVSAWVDVPSAGWRWIPVVLGVLLWLAGFDYLRQSSGDGGLPLWRQLLRRLGMIPVMLMIGVGVTVALLGVFQGTLVPQVGVVVRSDLRLNAQPAALFGGLLTLVLTTATLLQLTWEWPAGGVPAWLRAPINLWRWIGLRALWFAAGVLFARLAASRLSLLIGWLESLGSYWEATGLRNLWLALWGRL